ncbi:MAG TPA: GTPase Era [Spirochaetia bacterium]|nr:GTPase Era [Spirochaetia bacterium]
MKSAVVAVVGRPSAGKSTLVNALCGGKVSIVSPVPQTTRNRVRGILNDPRGQLVFIDTPGFHLSQRKINVYMTDLVSSVLSEVDVVLYVVDGTRETGEEERSIQGAVQAARRPLVIAVNKQDAAAAAWDRVCAGLSAAFPTPAALPISARTGGGLGALRDALFEAAPEGDQMYPEDFYTDQAPEFRVSEIIREKATLQTREEVPHALYVRIEDLEMREGGKLLWVRGFICVERESQKGIVVGREGERIKAIVRDSERELCEIFPYRVKLDIRVKVDRDWRRRDPLLKRLIT